jgi:two-component system, sensor histidine kinase YesM
MKHRISLKNTLLIFIIVGVLMPIMAVSIFSYNRQYRSVYNDVSEQNDQQARKLQETLDKAQEKMNIFLTTVLYSPEASLFYLNCAHNHENEAEKGKLYLELSELVEKEMKGLSDQTMLLSVYLESNGSVVSIGPYHFLYDDEKMLQNLLEQTTGVFQTFSIEKRSHYMYTGETDIISISKGRKAYNESYSGKIVAQIDADSYYNMLKNAIYLSESKLYIFDDKGNLVATNESTDRMTYSALLDSCAVDGRYDDELYTYSQSSYTGWTVFSISPKNELLSQTKSIMMDLLVIGFSIVFFILTIITLLVNKTILKPFKEIVEDVKAYGSSDFSEVVTNSHNYLFAEFDTVAVNVNKMKCEIACKIKQLKEANENEIKSQILMLQSQINPHFMYNTLASIAYMAHIQKAVGIKSMVNDLERLLRGTLGKIDDKITIQEELAIVKSYVDIMWIRYSGKFEYELDVPDERLLECKILKFILQPLIENSILHGLESKGGQGFVRLSIRENEAGRITIVIEDNGIGVSQDEKSRINQELLTVKRVDTERRNIGLMNIANRIKLIYGDGYGVRVESEENIYFRVAITIPEEA